ncbi:hypothetical protein OG21DRAFT_1527783, partial [Imleria badia]
MSIFNSVKNVLATINKDQLKHAEFLGDDKDCSYDIFINPQHPSQLCISNHAGDIYIQLDCESLAALCSIRICDEHKAWVLWKSNAIIKVTVLDKLLYPIPCPKHGVQYVDTAQHTAWLSSKASQDVGDFAKDVDWVNGKEKEKGKGKGKAKEKSKETEMETEKLQTSRLSLAELEAFRGLEVLEVLTEKVQAQPQKAQGESIGKVK